MGIYLELASLVWFLICWLGYSLYSQHAADKRPCLSNTLDLYRTDWMRVMLSRENRISDASVVGNLERNGAFFASSCLLILAGIITALAVVAWFVHPVAFIGASTLIVIILYRREFRSDALVALRAGKVFEDSVARADTEKGKTSV
jgi:uncharacterized membrane protein